ncbi:hypothetical protein AVEN_133863-1 [Araneus ventricosus]|uniref:SOCS box domain-containing protein n=1 Tax=Araneus ventricosus TaxID=182803 RepID=A0A4Y2TGJ1_ARAVE|nr:hypothetical protein AVEN_133863-1 [Araneus ventricosus]
MLVVNPPGGIFTNPTLIELRRNIRTVEGLAHPNDDSPRKKMCFFAMLTHIAFIKKSESGIQALRLLWRSISFRFITLDDFEDIYLHILTEREIKDIYSFYTDIIGQDVPDCEPRKLKHKCRCIIRAALGASESLPEGISELGLPPDIQLYLKLQK